MGTVLMQEGGEEMTGEEERIRKSKEIAQKAVDEMVEYLEKQGFALWGAKIVAITMLRQAIEEMENEGVLKK